MRDGRLAAGAPLPTVRALARDLRLSPATVAAAYRLLRLRGLLSTGGRRGTRVSARPPLPSRLFAPVPAHLRNLADGNPDPRLLPRLRWAAGQGPPPRLYGREQNLPELLKRAARQLAEDGIPVGSLAVVGGAMDGVERVLQAHLRPGDVVAVEDPGYPAVFDLVAALGLLAEPMEMDEAGVRPAALHAALRAGARAAVLTPRAQNPTGSAWDASRQRELRAVLADHPDALVLEDDHAGPIAGVPALSLANPKRERWAVVRSASKSLGPDLRLSVLAADAVTLARVEGRQSLGPGWVSHIIQDIVARAWADAPIRRQLAAAAATYTSRRQGLIRALARHGIAACGRSGLNVWVPVPEEAAAVAALAQAGWAIRAGERYRLKSPPAVRVTVAALEAREAEAVAAALAQALRPERRAHTA